MKENFCCTNNRSLLASEYARFSSDCQNLDSCEFIRDSSFCTSMHFSNDVHFSRFSAFCEHLIFCYSAPNHSKYMAFGKQVSPERYNEIRTQVIKIFGHLKVENNLITLYEALPNEYWEKLRTIPEFDNKEVLSITNIDVDAKLQDKRVTITCEGRDVRISRESAIALNLVKE